MEETPTGNTDVNSGILNIIWNNILKKQTQVTKNEKVTRYRNSSRTATAEYNSEVREREVRGKTETSKNS